MKKASILLILFLLLSGALAPKVYAQTRHCGTVPLHQDRSAARFEQWLLSKIQQKQARRHTEADEEPIYRVPVVVHIVHQGEPVGEGSNVSFEQIEDQIRILNEDFRRQNPDTTNTPEIFRPVAADTRIEFVLARQDPNGAPTNGVVRVEADREAYNLNDPDLAVTIQWDPERYLNLWVTTIVDGFLGYAQIPVSDLPGLEGAPRDPATDGAVVDYRNFGSIGTLRQRNALGRTATHEVGHFLGLRHVWGDGDCDADDFVEDTPPQDQDYGSPPGCPEEATSCSSRDMYENYMDYTDDVCMNLFTEGQKLRMRTVLENSPRRASLLTSPALEVPNPVLNDASIVRIVTPQRSECSAQLTPRITVLNVGSNVINSVTAEVNLQGNRVGEATFEVNLLPGESQDLTFPSPEVTLNPSTPYEASFTIVRINNTIDDSRTGNQESTVFFIAQEATLPAAEGFRPGSSPGFFEKSVVINPDDSITWAIRDVPTTAEPNNRALSINFLEYQSVGAQDFLYTPTLNLSSLTTSTLRFRVAHAQFSNADIPPTQDGLRVGVSTDCGATVDEIIYEKFGAELATHPITDANFVPTGPDDWREEIISLDNYVGEPNVQLIFIGINNYGNNLYLDDIELFVTEYDSLQPAESSFSIEPNPVVNQRLEVEFNLRSADDVTVAVCTPRGRVMAEYVLPNTLNQTYTLDLSGYPAGVYVLRALGRTIEEGKRFILR